MTKLLVALGLNRGSNTLRRYTLFDPAETSLAETIYLALSTAKVWTSLGEFAARLRADVVFSFASDTAKGGDELAKHERARPLLEQELSRVLDDLGDRLEALGCYDTLEAELANALDPIVFELPERDGMLALDAELANALERVGPVGTEYAKVTREASRKRWERRHDQAVGELVKLWNAQVVNPDGLDERAFMPFPKFGAVVLEAVWRDVVRPRIEEAIERERTPAAIARAVSVDVLDLCTQQYKVEDRDGQQTLKFHDQRGWVLVPSIFDDALAGILHRGIDLLTSEIGIDLLEWEVTKAHSQWASGEADFRRIVVEGGWSAIAHEHLGRTSKSDADRVRAIVLAQAHLQFQTYGIRGNLLSYAEPQRHAPGRRAVVTLTLGDMLLYSYAQALCERHGKTSLSSREGRRLVPLLGKTVIVGRTNEHAAQRRMVWRLAILLRDHAEELARTGAVRITIGDWMRIAGEAGLPRNAATLSRVLDAWTKGDTKTPPLLVAKDTDRYTLHESRRDALDFITNGGRISTRKRAQGKASARARARGLWKKPNDSS